MSGKKKYYLGFCLLAVSGLLTGCPDDGIKLPFPGDACSETKSCGTELRCVEGVCKTPVPENGDCSGEHKLCEKGECISGVCTDNVIVDKCESKTDCKTGYDCHNGECKRPVNVGGVCSVKDTYCKDGVCDKGVCVAVSDNPPPGGPCIAGKSKCPTDYTCKDGTCQKGVPLGSKCDEPGLYCLSGMCVEGTCQNVHPMDIWCANNAGGQACSNNASCGGGDVFECRSGKCVNLKCTDTDGDTISDYYDRCDVDTDGDTVPDCMDLDSDGDTIPDSVEAGIRSHWTDPPVDSDGDTIPDFLDLDSDSNGIPDAIEGKRIMIDPETGAEIIVFVDTDGDGILDHADFDNDGDTIPDIDEIYGVRLHNTPAGFFAGNCGYKGGKFHPLGSPESPIDCDGDTIPDYLSVDSVGSTIGDFYKGVVDSDNDGILDRYSLDSDGDGLPDSEERGTAWPLPPLMSNGWIYDFRTPDIDEDGLLDGLEVFCPNLKPVAGDEVPCASGAPWWCQACKDMRNQGYGHSKFCPDIDGDGYSDAAEYVAAMAIGVDPAVFICDADKGVKDVFDFYFELPYRKPAKDDDLIFKPAVSKLDVIFNMDTTGSMGGEVNNLKGRIRDYIYPQIRMRVGDSGFGVTYFEDFPVNGYGAAGDLPYRLLGAVSTNPDVITAAVNQLTVRNGGDGPESGYESLWQIVMGNDRSYPQAAWSSTANGPIIGSIPYYDPAPGTWGGVGFRDGTLPVVVHITDVVSHDHNQNPYDTRFVRNPHYSTDVHPAYQAKGARVVSIYRNSSGVQLGQLVGTSQVTNAIVPACAFKQPSGAWRCGENRCCTVTSASGVAPIAGNSCVLSYGISSSGTMSDTLVEGIDALVKYGTYEVSTVIHGEPIRDMHGNLTGKDTSCFIKRVESVRYIAPEQEPEMSCNPVAVPTQVGGVGYNNGFANFAPGTSNAARPGAQLVFRVVAENDTCFAPEKTARSFKAYIDVVNPTTGLLFGRREVVIIVPGEINIVPG